MRTLYKAAYKTCAFLSGLALALMMLQIFADIVARLGFNGLVPGTQEIVGYYYMVIATYMGLFVTEVVDEHISTDVLVHLFSEKWQRFTAIVDRTIAIIFFSLFSYGLILAAINATEESEHVDAIWFDMTVWPTRWVAVIGCLLTVVALFLKRYRDVSDHQPMLVDEEA